MKKVISLVLVFVMVFSVSVTAFVANAENEEYPTIYVTGAQTNNLYSADGEKIYPLSANIIETLLPTVVPALEELALGMATQDYKAYSEMVCGYVTPLFEDVMLDKNGEASDGSHPEYHSSTVPVSDKQSDYDMWDYRFWYDWRLSPLTTAEELKDYIDRVIDATGKDKVQLVGRCYGANVIQTYITLYKEHAIANVSDVAYYASSIEGIDFMSAFFSGELVLEEQAVVNFVDYYLEYEKIIEDDALSAFVYSLVEILNHAEVLGLGTDAVIGLVDALKGDLIPMLLPVVVGSWPSYWTMVTPELYEKSIEFIFGDKREEYKNFIEKTDYYHYNVQLKSEETILEMQEKGINFYIFTKYGFADMPLYEGATIEGDSYTSVPRQSFGAECSDHGEVFNEKYINSLDDKTYLSPDYKINAATCLIPERSWFIKNLHHNEFAVLHDMTLEIMRYDLTVESETYPQYFYHENAVLTPVTGTDEDYGKNPSDIIGAAMRLLTAFIRLISKLISGELSLDLSGILG